MDEDLLSRKECWQGLLCFQTGREAARGCHPPAHPRACLRTSLRAAQTQELLSGLLGASWLERKVRRASSLIGPDPENVSLGPRMGSIDEENMESMT